MENNKHFASILLAGIIAMGSGFVAELLIHPKQPQAKGWQIEVATAPAGPGAANPPPAAEAEPIAPLLASANVENGEKLAKACAACHTFDKGGPNRVGPNLWGTVGADKAHVEGYSYSPSLAKMPGEWTYEDLNKFLHQPKDFVPGTKMTYAGLKKAQERADLIAWLRTKSDAPPPLPQ